MTEVAPTPPVLTQAVQPRAGREPRPRSLLPSRVCAATQPDSSVLPAGGGKATALGCLHTPSACPWGFHPPREAYEVAMPGNLPLALQRAGTALCCVQVRLPSGKEGAGGNAAGCAMSENLGCTQQPHDYTLFC